MRRAVGGSSVAVLVALLGLAGVVALVAAAAEPTRADYVTRLEAICKPGSDATERAVRGVRGDVHAERFALAARKFARAQRIFAGTVSSIVKVPRPSADRAVLERWFDALAKEQVYLAGIVKSLRTDDLAAFQRVSANFIHEGNRANNAVVSFGFNYCAFRPTRFQ